MEIMVLILILFMGTTAKRKINWSCAVMWYRPCISEKENINVLLGREVVP